MLPEAQILVPWMGAAAAAESIALLQQHVGLPGDCVASATPGGLMLPEQIASSSCPRKQGSPGLAGRMAQAEVDGLWVWRQSLARVIPRRWPDEAAAERSLPFSVLG